MKNDNNTHCAKCEEEAAKLRQNKINEAINKARQEAPERNISGTSVVILQTVNGGHYFWATEDDERAGRLPIVDRVYID